MLGTLRTLRLQPLTATGLKSTISCRALHAKSTRELTVPSKRDDIETPEDLFNKAAKGRDLVEHLSKLGENITWEDLFTKYKGPEMKAAGIPTKDRRYMLWVMEKFRNGDEKYWVPLKPKKKFRGHGPRIQFGRYIR